MLEEEIKKARTLEDVLILENKLNKINPKLNIKVTLVKPGEDTRQLMLAYMNTMDENNLFYSINSIQSALLIGFNRASYLVGLFESLGICSIREGKNPRVPLVSKGEAIRIINEACGEELV